MNHADFESELSAPAASPALWPLDPEIVFLNHGSFGSCPIAVLDRQTEYRRQLEREPVTFLVRELEGRLNSARAALSEYVGCDREDLVFVPNAITGVNTVLRSLSFAPGEEILVTDHEYNACRNALDFAAERSGAVPVVVPIPFPISSPDEIVERVMERVTSRSRLALIDHVTSQTGMILPVAELTRRLRERNVDVLVDGAHAPGMIPLNLSQLGAAYYTGNCHKWICAPKGAAFLYANRTHQAALRPLTISHGANSPRTDRSRFQIEFGWTGTGDPSAVLCVEDALRFMNRTMPGGWDAILRRNHALAVRARTLLCDALGVKPPCPEEMLGSMASIPIRDSASTEPSKFPLYLDPWQDRLMEQYKIEVPIIPWPSPPKRLLRISAQLYNSVGQYQKLADALRDFAT